MRGCRAAQTSQHSVNRAASAGGLCSGRTAQRLPAGLGASVRRIGRLSGQRYYGEGEARSTSRSTEVFRDVHGLFADNVTPKEMGEGVGARERALHLTGAEAGLLAGSGAAGYMLTVCLRWA